MNLLDLMLMEKSSQKFGDGEVPKEKLNNILKSALLALKSKNTCDFIIINNTDTLLKLSKSISESDIPAGCSKAVAVVANTVLSDTWLEDSTAAICYMELMASEQKIASHWIKYHQLKDLNSEICKVLGIDSYFNVCGILALGIPDDELKLRDFKNIDKSNIHFLR